LDLKQKTGSEHVDIITFYNEMFIPSVKPLLVELAPAGNEQKNNHVEKTKNDGEFSLLCGCEVIPFF